MRIPKHAGKGSLNIQIRTSCLPPGLFPSPLYMRLVGQHLDNFSQHPVRHYKIKELYAIINNSPS